MSARDNRGAALEIDVYSTRWEEDGEGHAFEGEWTVILQPGESRSVLNEENCWRIYADIGNPQVTEVTIALKEISRISEARWRIEIPH